jgi:glycosyltransferase involved in cell wall biosynthesis
MDYPLVSVIMPTYNREVLLVEAVDSVIEQSYEHWELIIVDDGSVDNTAAVVNDRYGKDERIKYIHQPNQGQSVARNNGVEFSSGEYIAFLDSDNLWDANRLREGVSVLQENPEVGLCYADVIYIDANSDEIHRINMPRYTGFVFPKLIVDNFVSMNTVMVRRAVLPSLRPFNQKNRLDEDYELWLDMSVKNQYFYIPKYLAYYRIEGERISNNFMVRLDANETTVKKILTKYNVSVSEPDIRLGLSRHYLRRASIVGRNDSFIGALSCLKKAMTYNFFSLAPVMLLMRLILRKAGLKK